MRAHCPSVPGNVTTKADLSNIVDEIEKQAPDGIHILFNNAGVAGEGSREGYELTEDAEKFEEQLWKSSEEEWARILNVNVIGYYVSGYTNITVCRTLFSAPSDQLVVHRRSVSASAPEGWKVHQRLRQPDHQRLERLWDHEGLFRWTVRVCREQGGYCAGGSCGSGCNRGGILPLNRSAAQQGHGGSTRSP
jgi:hypothetical protein